MHDLRVAIRRVAQALAAFKRILPRKAVKRIRKRLKGVLSAAGAVRDCDIAIKVLLKTTVPEATDLRRKIRERRKTAERSLLVGLKRLSLRTQISRWLADLNLHTPQAESVAEARAIAMQALPQMAKRFFDAGEGAASHDSGEKLHEFRIEAKKFRYTLELFIPVYGKALEERIGDIKSIQSVLGKMNDYRSVLAMAAEFGCGKKLKANLKRSERRKIRQFRKMWAERFSISGAHDWKLILRAGPPEPPVTRKPVGSSATPARLTRRKLAGAMA